MISEKPQNYNPPASHRDDPDNQPQQYAALANTEGQGETAFADIVRQNLGAAGLQASDLERVRVPSGGVTTWELPGLNGIEPVEELRGIIIAIQTFRNYYPDPYTGESVPADCTSSDAVWGHGRPGGACAECPLAKWGSAQNGRGQACGLRKRLFFLLPDRTLPVMVDIPSGSLSNLRKYLVRLTDSSYGHTDVVTAIHLQNVKNASGVRYSQATFNMADVLDPALRQHAQEYAGAIRDVMTTKVVSDYDDDKPRVVSVAQFDDDLDDASKLKSNTEVEDPFDA